MTLAVDRAVKPEHKQKLLCEFVSILSFQNSLTKQPHDTDSPGRSGARMMLSHDRRYFIKTLVSEEVEQMHHVLKQYHQVGFYCTCSFLDRRTDKAGI